MRKLLPYMILVFLFTAPMLACGGSSDELVFSPGTLPEATAGQAYTATITLSNQNTPAFQMGAAEEDLPPGLTGEFDQDTQTYTISGTPTQAGTYTFRVSAICYGTNVSGQTGGKTYEIVVK